MLPPGLLVPEGDEDLSYEANVGSCDVQVKSRQERVDDFPVSTAAGHLLKLLVRHQARAAAGRVTMPVLVWERAVAGESFGAWGVPLAQTLPPGHRLRESLSRKARAAGFTRSAVDSFLEVASGFVLSWRTAHEETLDAVHRSGTGLPRGVLFPAVLALRAAVADRSDANTEPDRDQRYGLSSTDIARCVSDNLAHINRDALDEAVRRGLCELVDFYAEVASSSFYAGVDVQPGHVGARLTAGRPDVVGRVVDALGEPSPVLVNGPSGIGKSAVMWMAAYVTPHIRWYRVRRLHRDDVEPLVRLIREAGTSLHTPVGLVVDGVGTGAMEAWDLLLRDLAPVPGATLIGSVRTEDLLPLRSLHNSTVITVDLDEPTAERIYRGLVDAGQTSLLHWRPAFEQSGRLTLEYTYLLTQGHRLVDVVSDQVKRRIHEGRDLELRVLALASVAHRWGATLGVDRLCTQLDQAPGALRRALERLNAEHLVHFDDDHIVGVHRLRSLALITAIHATPPPGLASTVEDVLPHLETDQLRTFLAGVLGDVTTFDERILAWIEGRLRQERSSLDWCAVIDALRIADTRRLSAHCTKILDENQIAQADRILVIQQALLGGGIFTAFGANAREDLAAAAAHIIQAAAAQQRLSDTLIDRLGSDLLTEVLLSCRVPKDATALLAVLAGAPDPCLASTTLEGLTADHPFTQMLRTSDITLTAKLLATAYDVTPSIALALNHAAGGDAALLERVKQSTPWILEANVANPQVAFARFLHIDAGDSTDPTIKARELAKLMLWSFPSSVKADVQAVAANLKPLSATHPVGVCNLDREYAKAPSTTRWMRTRMLIGADFAARTDPAARAHHAINVLNQSAALLDDATRTWCLNQPSRTILENLTSRAKLLINTAGNLVLPLDNALHGIVEAVDGQSTLVTDSVYQLARSTVNVFERLFNNAPLAPLAAFVADNAIRDIAEIAATERWELADLDQPPEALTTIELLYRNLHPVLAEVAAGGLTRQNVEHSARRGNKKSALERAARRAEDHANRRVNTAVSALTAAARHLGTDLEVIDRPYADPKGRPWPPVQHAILIPLPSLEDTMSTLRSVASLVNEHLPRFHAPVLLVPTFQGKPLKVTAQQVITGMWPAFDLYDTWADALPPPWPTPLADTVTEVHRSLEAISATTGLPQQQQDTEQVERFAHAQLERANAATAALGTSNCDVVFFIRHSLTVLANRVQDELDGHVEHTARLSVNLATDALESDNPDITHRAELLGHALLQDLGIHPGQQQS